MKSDSALPGWYKWGTLAVVWSAAAVYAWAWLDHGWIPHDDGTLAHSAERVLSGELPHRDFDELYTGGLSYINAFAFRILGIDLLAPRLALFALFLVWVPAFFYAASRFAPPLLAGLATCLAVVWSLPSYPAAMPSWYCLFLASLGTAALLRYVDTRHGRWIFAAGACAGASIAIKIIGAYFVAGGLLFLVFHERRLAQERSTVAARAGPGSRAYPWFVGVALALFLGVVIQLLRGQPSASNLAHFLLPIVAVAGLLFTTNPRNHDAPGARFAALARIGLPFLLGIAAPLLVFVIPYISAGALPELVRGVFILPTSRLTTAEFDFPPLHTIVWALPATALLAGAARLRGPLGWTVVGVTLALAGWLLTLGGDDAVHGAIWLGMRPLVPIVVLAGAAQLFLQRGDADSVQRERTFLVLAASALCSLVQFPFAHPIYFFYIAPLALLPLIALTGRFQPAGRALVGTVLAFYTLFAALWVHGGSVYTIGRRYVPDEQTERLDLERGGPTVNFEDKVEYERLVEVLRRHARGGYTYVTPDTPEAYFLADLRNATRTLFDLFDDPVGRTSRVLRALEEHDVHAIALNRRLEFTTPSPTLLAELLRLYPYELELGPRFLVRWRE